MLYKSDDSTILLLLCTHVHRIVYYIRFVCNTIVKIYFIASWKRLIILGDAVIFSYYFQALNGFLMMMTQNGKLLYISDNAAEYLGHSMVSVGKRLQVAGAASRRRAGAWKKEMSVTIKIYLRAKWFLKGP